MMHYELMSGMLKDRHDQLLDEAEAARCHRSSESRRGGWAHLASKLSSSFLSVLA